MPLLCLDGAATALLLPGPPAPGWASLFSPCSRPATEEGRQAGTRDPRRQGCTACTWTQLASRNKMHTHTHTHTHTKTPKLHGTKNNHVHSWLGQTLDQKIPKDQRTQLPILKGLEQRQGVGSKSKVLSMPPALGTTKGWAHYLSHPSSQTPRHTPTLTPCKEQACPLTTADQESLAWISCLASDQYPLIGEG